MNDTPAKKLQTLIRKWKPVLAAKHWSNEAEDSGFGDACFSLGFEMDAARSLQGKYPGKDVFRASFLLIVSECFIGDQNPGKRQKRAAMSVRTNFFLNSQDPNFSNFSRSGYSASRKILSEICQNSHRFKTEKLTAREKAHPHVRRESVFRGKALDFFLLWFIVILAVIAAAGRGYRFGGLSGTASSA